MVSEQKWEKPAERGHRSDAQSENTYASLMAQIQAKVSGSAQPKPWEKTPKEQSKGAAQRPPARMTSSVRPPVQSADVTESGALRGGSMPAHIPERGAMPGAVISSEQIAGILQGLNPQQEAAVKHNGGPLLVVAGAGSGKTRVLTSRIAYLIATGQASAENILAITFTNKAAREMKERLGSMIGPVVRRMWVSTFHSACVRILRAEHDALNLRSSFTIYDTADTAKLLGSVITELNIDKKTYSAKYLAHHISDLKNELVSPAQAADRAMKRDEEIVAQAYELYQTKMAEANALDFDDLISKAVQLFRSRPDIAARYRERFTHILVDEYQDTNHAQYVLIRELTGTRENPVQGHVTVVGDADQSIYAFRGATISNIQNFEDDFPGAEVIMLEQNYRSTQTILSAANAVIAHNEHTRVKKLWTDHGQGEKIVGYVADSAADEAAFVVDEIETLHASSSTKPYRYKDVAVFYRTNAQSRAVEEQFVRAGIPYRVVGGTKFYDRREIKDALSYMHAVANPDDVVSLRRIMNVPRRGIGHKAQEALEIHSLRYHKSLFDVLEDVLCDALDAGWQPEAPLGIDASTLTSDTTQADAEQTSAEVSRDQHVAVEGLSAKARNSLAQFTAMLKAARAQAQSGRPPADVLSDVMENSGYLAMLKESKDVQDEARLDNIAQLHTVAEEFSTQEPEGTLDDWLSSVALISDADQVTDEDGDGDVTLMTVHTAKGLEFPVVFVTGMEDGIFPHSRALDDPDELSEERRLAYVALTRAQELLYVTRAAVRSLWGLPEEFPPSRFLEEIPPELIDWRRDESSVDTLRSEWDDAELPAWGAGGYSGYQWRGGRAGNRRGIGNSGGTGNGGGRRLQYSRSAHGDTNAESGHFTPGLLGGPSEAGLTGSGSRRDSSLQSHMRGTGHSDPQTEPVLSAHDKKRLNDQLRRAVSSRNERPAQEAHQQAAHHAGELQTSAGEDLSHFHVGEAVEHKAFGTGTIMALSGKGRSLVAEVRFDSGVTKRLMLRFAPLTRVDE
ncbi:MAG: UvrD-helicase domain-containing protein [Actinomycetaceae bacterium]|nr:exodeoxyribonuclease V subunit gamma [Actinomycetaceae bacterium]MDY6082902.1 UvrD-helicase domain-containing protein [Actinomycetaceae bacterium]